MSDIKVYNQNYYYQLAAVQKKAAVATDSQSIMTTQENKNNNMTGLEVERKPKAGKHASKATKEIFKLTDEQYNALSLEKKGELQGKAIRKMIKAHNLVHFFDKKGQLTESHQFGLYISRAKSEEDFKTLAIAVKELSPEEQIEAFKISYKNGDPKYRPQIEAELARVYTELHVDNVPEAVKNILKDFSEENQVKAAGNASNADVKVQNEVVKTFMSAEKEKIDNTLAKQVGQFGIDKDGKVNNDAQLAIYKQINTSKFESTQQIAAQNIYSMSEENRKQAVEITKATGNQKAIEAIKIEAPKANKETETTKTVDYNQAIKEAVANNDKATIKECLDTMKTSEVMEIIAENQNNTELMNTILSCNPSITVINEIDKVLRNSNNVSYKAAAKEISFLSDSLQTDIVKEAAKNSNLDIIKRNYLNLTARREYDNYESKLMA